jgi:transposase-like protein
MEVVQDCKRSGQSNIAYCREHGIKIKTFYYWQNKLRRDAAGALTGGITLPVGTEQHSIVPVNVTSTANSGITIRKDGFTVEFAGNVSATAIETVLAALSRTC